MVRASAHGDLRIMIPMIASLDELREVRKLLDAAIAAVDQAKNARAEHIPLGIMVEVPAAAIMASELATIAEFLSIGTNDLVQYALAVDRTNHALANLGSPFDPAILRLIRSVLETGTARGRADSVCGAMASNPIAAVLLVGMGLRELSMEASEIPVVKEAIGRSSLSELEKVVTSALELVTAREIEQRVTEAFGPRFADLLGDE
jgi:phosphotransferase system enzyme I (PtsI)